MKDLISAIIPTYKPKNYLWECLHSLEMQTLSPTAYEVIIVLNGCNEPYYTEINKYIREHLANRNVHFIQTNQSGVSNARNIGLDIAKGDYVTFIDDDDFISPTYLEEMYSLADGTNLVCCYPYAFNDGNVSCQLPYGITEAYEYAIKHHCHTISSKVRKYFSGPCMKLIPMSFIQERRFDIRFRNGEDSIFMFLISDRIKSIALTSRQAIYYRRYRVGSATYKRTIKDRLPNIWNMCKAYSEIYWKNPSKYSFLFYCTRLLACAKSIFIG